jgi:hypothetical protein
MVATLNDRMDYFGATVRDSVEVPRFASRGEVVLTQAVAADPQVAALLAVRGLEAEVMALDAPRAPGGMLHRLVPRGSPLSPSRIS